MTVMIHDIGRAAYQNALVERLDWYTEPEPMSGCWLWTGCVNHAGYGVMSAPGTRERLAHRVAFTVAHGPIPDGLCVLHRCDVPSCINPAHLFLGTRAVNNADRDAKGRRNQARGVRIACARLTDEVVRSIRELGAAGESHRSIARHFGIGHTTVGCVLRGTYWAHVA